MELDSHANMPVIGKNAYVIRDSGRKASVTPYSPEYQAKELSIVDALVLYQDEVYGKEYLLLIRNALYVPSLQHHLIPPFILREKGIQVRDTAKIHLQDPGNDDHAIIFDQTFRIPLNLFGIFSCFKVRKPTIEEVNTVEDVYLMTPDDFNPHDPAYALNEEQMLDWKGDIVPEMHRQRILLEDVPELPMEIASATCISTEEQHRIDALLLDSIDESDHKPTVRSEIAALWPNLCEVTLSKRLQEKAEETRLKCSLGATVAHESAWLEDDSDDEGDEESTIKSDEQLDAIDEDELMDQLYEKISNGEISLGDLDAEDLRKYGVSSTYAKPKQGLNAAHLSKVWKIDLQTAQRTLDATTQRQVHQDTPHLARNFDTGDRMLRYRRIHQYFFMDTFFASKKRGMSSRKNTCCQLFVTDKGFVYVVPMQSKKNVLSAVKQFAKEIGAPDAVIADAAGEQTSQDLKKFLKSIGTSLRILEKGTPWANKAELYIGLLKAAVRRDMASSNCPLAFWDYCVERRARINNLTARDIFKLHGQVPQTTVTGETGDISNVWKFGWYEWCYFLESSEAFPQPKKCLARCLGPATGVGNEMSQWVLKENGKVVARRTVVPLTEAERHNPIEVTKRELFDRLIERRWGRSLNQSGNFESSDVPGQEEENTWEPYSDEEEQANKVHDMDDVTDARGLLINQQPMYDKFLNLELQLHNGMAAKVMKRITGESGEQVGLYDDNPMLNSIMYEVEFDDGQIKEYSATAIAENILSQVDDDGFSSPMFRAIVGHRKNDNAVGKNDRYVQDRHGRKRPRKTTKGWELEVLWSNGSNSWIELKHLKESNPVDVAEYAVASKIDKEPAFSWWVKYTLRKRDAIISAVRARARKVTHKYGIELPTSVEHAYELDQKNGNTFWRDAIQKEMYELGRAIEIKGEEVTRAPPGWSQVSGHIVWDVKMDFTRKMRWVLDGHKTPDPIYSNFAGVVSRESVRIVLTYAALNDLDVCAADIRNAYLQAPSSRKDYIICGPEFGLENVGRIGLIHRALYGGKTAGRDFRNHLRSCMHFMGFVSCPADPDVWMRPAEKESGEKYWEYLLLYTDDALCVSEHPERTLRNDLGRYFQLKEESIGPPKIYLGGSIRKVELETGVKAWAFGSAQYVQAAVKNVEKYLSEQQQSGDDRFSVPKRVRSPMRTSYRPELDTSAVLGSKEASYYQSLIGVLRWIVELGRVDIVIECSMMSSYVTMPRVGHLEQVLNIFGYLKSHHNAELVFDPTPQEIDEDAFRRRDWSTSEFGHLEQKEELPPNAPEARGSGFHIVAKVDADHGSDTVTRRSRSGFFVWINSALVCWFSKKQTSVESSSFGSEFCAMKQCCEYIRGLRYKLRMMGIPIYGPAYIHGDNQSVLANTTIPESQLKKKMHSLAYFFIREGVSRDEWRTSYINTHENESDMLTKMLPDGQKRRKFVRRLLHHVYQSTDAIGS